MQIHEVKQVEKEGKYTHENLYYLDMGNQVCI